MRGVGRRSHGVVSRPGGARRRLRDVDAGHLRRYSRHGLEDVVGRSGLVVERVTYYQWTLFPVFAVVRLAMRRWRPLRDAEEVVPRLLNALLTIVNVVEAPDPATIARVSVALGARGSAKLQTLTALSIDEFLGGITST